MISCNLFGGCILASLLHAVTAQTPFGFMPSVSVNLDVTYGSNNISPPGKLIPRPEVASPPTISIPSNMTTSNNKGLIFMIDQDVPRNGSRVINLHWMAPNVDISSNPIKVPVTPGGVRYRQSNPPVGDFPHRYTFIIFNQPNDFTIPEQYSTLTEHRIGFNLTTFALVTDLGTPLAANYMTVQNTTGTATTTFPPIVSGTGIATATDSPTKTPSKSTGGPKATNGASKSASWGLSAVAGMIIALW